MSVYRSVSFPLQQWFRERASILRYMYIACLVLHTNATARTCLAIVDRFLCLGETCKL